MARIVTFALKIARAWALTTFVLKFANDWSMNLVSMIAYNLITAIFPILLVLLSLVGIFVQGHLQEVSTAISGVFPEARQSNIAVTPLLRSLVQITGPLAVVSFVALLWLGSN